MSSFDYDSENILFRQIAQGDESAYTKIFHLYTPRLYPYLLKITKDEQLAKEFVQESFLRLWLNREDLYKVNQPGSWLFRIAANLCLSHLRSKTQRLRLQDKVFDKMKPGSYQTSERVETKNLQLMIHKAVQQLPEKRKEVYLLSRNEGLTHKEIAETLNLSINTVKSQLGKALKSIQINLQKQTGLSIVALALIVHY